MESSGFLGGLLGLISILATIGAWLDPAPHGLFREFLIVVAALCLVGAIIAGSWRYRRILGRPAGYLLRRLRGSLIGLVGRVILHHGLYPKTPYVSFMKLRDTHALTFSFGFYNGLAVPARIAAVKGAVRYEGVSPFAGESVDPSLLDFAPRNLQHGQQNPFNRDSWAPGELIIVELLVSLDPVVFQHVQACYDANLAIKFRFSNLDILVSPDNNPSGTLRVPLANAIVCRKVPPNLAYVSEVVEASLKIQL